MHSWLIFVLTVAFQFLIYHIFLLKIITKWGASKRECSKFMLGDKGDLIIKSTRAISVYAKKMKYGSG